MSGNLIAEIDNPMCKKIELTDLNPYSSGNQAGRLPAD